MAALVEEFRGLHLPRTATLFEGLTLAILGQQISASVARVMRLLLIERFGTSVEFDGVNYHAFPKPEAIVAFEPSRTAHSQADAAEVRVRPWNRRSRHAAGVV